MIRDDELIAVGFAGGGGSCLGIRDALGRAPDVAINHDREAIAMHEANFGDTKHFTTNIWRVDPIEACGRAPVGLAWFSPDCKHFSKAKGGKPVEKRIRDLAWVVVLWAQRKRPRVIMLENVEEFADWGPLTEDGLPCPKQRGLTFRRWVRELKKFGYKIEWRELRACDYGAPTIRKRLFLIARCDGQPIVWPAPTHGPGRLPYRTAAEIIDWSLPCPSIFLTREEGRAIGVNRPLADATMARIAKGVQRYVLDAAKPFIVTMAHGSSNPHAARSVEEPMRTLTASHDGHGVVTPFLVPRYGERTGQDPRTHSIEEPMPTVVPTANGGSLVAAFLAQHNGGMVGHDARKPLSTITIKASHQQVVASHLINLKGSDRRMSGIDAPTPTQTSQGWHIGEVRAFLTKYYGTAVGQPLDEPTHTATARARMGLVTVAGEDFQIADIGMRMLTPRELFRAQGFPDSYIIDPELDGKRLTKTSQIRMCGNSVCPPVVEALVRANVGGRLTSGDEGSEAEAA